MLLILLMVSKPACMCIQHLRVSSLLFISSPNDFILGLPFTSIIIPHALIKASLVQVLFKHANRISFCCFRDDVFVMVSCSPCGMTPCCSSSLTTAIASISSRNRFQKCSSTSSAVRKVKSHNTHTCQGPLHTLQWTLLHGSTLTVYSHVASMM